MRVKRQKRHQKTVWFFMACFRFREPFRILYDGTFVHHLLANGISPANTTLANTLSTLVKIFTIRCDHEKRKSVVTCIIDVIGENNPEHFFVSTQDAELRKKFQEIPGVPVIYGLRKALLMEFPSSFQHEFTKTTEEERSHMTDLEYKMIKLKKKKVATDESRDFSDANKDSEDRTLEMQNLSKHTKSNRNDTKDKVQFKQKEEKVK